MVDLSMPYENYMITTMKGNGEVIQLEPMFVDIETTGLNSRTCDVINIAGVDLRGNKTLIIDLLPRPGVEISQTALELNGYDEEKAKRSIYRYTSHGDALTVVQRVLKGKVIVGSNPAFDTRFLENAIWDILKERPTWYKKSMCLGTLCYPIFEMLLPLETLAAKLSVPNQPNHTALADAMASRDVYVAAINKIKSAQLSLPLSTHQAA